MSGVKGLNQVLRKLDKEVRKIKGDTKKGMVKTGAYLKGETLEITPHDKGDLINSAFFSTDETGSKSRLRVGFTAKHAPHVHEMPSETNWSKPDTGNKFLEKTVKANFSKILRIIKASARIK